MRKSTASRDDSSTARWRRRIFQAVEKMKLPMSMRWIFIPHNHTWQYIEIAPVNIPLQMEALSKFTAILNRKQDAIYEE